MIPLALKAKSILGVIGSKIPLRWVIYCALASAVCFGASIYIHEVFTFSRWTGMTAAGLAGGFILFEIASVYYTGKIDIPGDGKKPKKG